MDKPRRDWTLGEIQDYCSSHHCNECLFNTLEENCRLKGDPENWDLTDPPRFTPREVEDAKTLLRLFDGQYTKVHRDSQHKWLEETDGFWQAIMPLSFPSVREGETVSLKEIAGQAD